MQGKNVSIAMRYPMCHPLAFLWRKTTADLVGEKELCVCVCTFIHILHEGLIWMFWSLFLKGLVWEIGKIGHMILFWRTEMGEVSLFFASLVWFETDKEGEKGFVSLLFARESQNWTCLRWWGFCILILCCFSCLANICCFPSSHFYGWESPKAGLCKCIA